MVESCSLFGVCLSVVPWVFAGGHICECYVRSVVSEVFYSQALRVALLVVYYELRCCVCLVLSPQILCGLCNLLGVLSLGVLCLVLFVRHRPG